MYISIWMWIPFLPLFMGFISMKKLNKGYIIPRVAGDNLESQQPKCINCIFFDPVLSHNGEVNAAFSKCIKFSMVDFNKHTNISFWNAESLRSSGALCGPTGNYFQDKNDY